MHPVLVDVFDALTHSGVRWSLLRGEMELEHVGEDVDLLVAPADMATAATSLEQLGYVEMPSWGRGSHRFFLSYYPAPAMWCKLDIVTRLAFGPHSVMETGTASSCLARRVIEDGVALLDVPDRFWALLLHCLLDRPDIPERHRRQLERLAHHEVDDSPLATWFSAHAPANWDVATAPRAVREQEWTSLVAVGHAMRSRSGGVREQVTGVQRGALRRLTKLRTLLAARGISVALLGPDGAGKSTLARGLAESFYFPARVVYMGLYGKRAGRVPRGLIGRVARQWGGVARGAWHRARGRLIIYDRWGYDSLLGAGRGAGWRARLRRTLLVDAVPDPDVIVLLDAPADLLYSRKQEHDVATLDSQRRAYLALAARLGTVAIVAADRDPDDIVQEVTALVWERYRQRARPWRGGDR